MTGRGWLIIYGLLILLLLYLFFSVSGLKGDVKDLKANVAELQQNSAKVAVASQQPLASPSVTPTPASNTSTAAGRDIQRKADLAKIAAALQAYKQSRGSFPAGLNELTPDYLDALPADPLSPRYNYRYKRIGAGFRLTCALELVGDPDDAKTDGQADKVYTVNFRGQ
jgi:hypothetical protein